MSCLKFNCWKYYNEYGNLNEFNRILLVTYLKYYYNQTYLLNLKLQYNNNQNLNQVHQCLTKKNWSNFNNNIYCYIYTLGYGLILRFHYQQQGINYFSKQFSNFTCWNNQQNQYCYGVYATQRILEKVRVIQLMNMVSYGCINILIYYVFNEIQ